MATKKSTPKKSTSKATSKKTTNKRSSTSSRGTASKNTKRNTKSVELIRANNQRKAIVLLALAVLLAALVFIPGENIWHGLHDFLMGTFGRWAIFWPVLLGYSAVTMALEKFQGDKGGLRKKILMCIALIFIICTAVFIYSDIPFPDGLNYLEKLAFLYTLGINNSGAALCGGLFGIPILFACGSIAAKILITVILVAAIMLLFKITISSIAQALEKGARAAKKTAINARDRQRERAEIRREERQILIDNPPPVHEDKEEKSDDYISGLSFEHPVFSKPTRKNDSNSEVDISVGVKDSKNDASKIFSKKRNSSATENTQQEGKFEFRFSDEALSKVPKTPEAEEIPTSFTSEPILIDRNTGEIIENFTCFGSENSNTSIENESIDNLISEKASNDDIYPSDYQFEDIQSDTKSDENSAETTIEESIPQSDEVTVEETENAFAEEKTEEHNVINSETPFKNVLREEKQESAVVTPIDLSDESLDNAKQAAEEYMEKREEAEKAEIASKAEMSLYDQHKDEEKTYIFPPVTLLKETEKLDASVETEELQTNGKILIDTLASFGVKAQIVDIARGPSVTRYEIKPAAGVKISKITGLADDLALNLAAAGIRIEAPIPGKAAVGIEVPNLNKSTVGMKELIESNKFIMSKAPLTVALGKDIAGEVVITDLAKMPHLLIAGTTGSGKSVCINSLIISLVYKSSPDDVRFLMVDPKVVELGVYNGIPHLLVPVVTDPRKAAGALNWAVTEMLNRYKTFAEFNVRDIKGYNELAKMNNYEDDFGQPMLKMPHIVVIIDELADLMMAAPNEVEDSICRLAQMARAAGMHLVVATQRPTVDVVTGLIKANIPSRIAFAVSSAIDSRTILDTQGAEKLLGRGDMLFSPVGSQKPTRVQGCFVSDGEIEKVIDFIKHGRKITYDDEIAEAIEQNAAAAQEKSQKGNNASEESQSESGDALLEEALKICVEAGQASTSLLQRKLRIGYARAGRYIDELEQLGYVGPYQGSKPRQVLLTKAQWLERNMQKDAPAETPTVSDETVENGEVL